MNESFSLFDFENSSFEYKNLGPTSILLNAVQPIDRGLLVRDLVRQAIRAARVGRLHLVPPVAGHATCKLFPFTCELFD